MNDERISELLAGHPGPASVDADFEHRLFSILQGEMRRRGSPRLVLLLAAALTIVGLLGAAAVGSGLLRLPSLDLSLIPQPTAVPSASAPPAGHCALTVRQIHVPEDMHPELEVATILDPPPPGTPYRVRMTGDRAGTPAAFVNAFGDDWGAWLDVVETGPGGVVSEYTLSARRGHGWATAFTAVGQYAIDLSSPRGCAATLLFEVAE